MMNIKNFPKRGFRSKSWLWIIFLFLLWGTTWPLGKIATNYFAPELLVTLRFTSAGLILVLYAAFSGRLKRIPKRVILVALGIGFFQYFLYYLLSYYALHDIGASKASVLGGSYPLFVALMTREFWKEKKFILLRLLGFLFGLIGVAITVGYTPWSSGLFMGIGDFLMVAASLCLALGSRLLKFMRSDDYTLQVTAFGMVFAGIFASFTLPLQSNLFLINTWIAWIILIYLVLIGSICVFLMWNRLIIRNPLVEIASYNYLLPIFGVFTSYIILRENISFSLILGSALIIIGIFLTSTNKVWPQEGKSSSSEV
jgi:probable blue pigment (indigoidine) exporter